MHCHPARGTISTDRRWRLQVASSFGHKTRRLPDDVVPRGEQGTRNGREEAITGIETGTRTRAGMSTRVGMEGRTGAGTGTRIEIGEGGGEPGNLQSGNRGGSEDARGRATQTSKQQPRPQDPTPHGRKARDRIGEGRGKVKKRKDAQRSYRRNVGN